MGRLTRGRKSRIDVRNTGGAELHFPKGVLSTDGLLVRRLQSEFSSEVRNAWGFGSAMTPGPGIYRKQICGASWISRMRVEQKPSVAQRMRRAKVSQSGQLITQQTHSECSVWRALCHDLSVKNSLSTSGRVLWERSTVLKRIYDRGFQFSQKA